MAARIRKTYKPPESPGGKFHREHRSKKNRKRRLVRDFDQVKRHKQRIDEILEEELDAQASAIWTSEAYR